MNARQENYVRNFSDNQATLRVLQAAKTTSPLVQQCQKAFNDISTYLGSSSWTLRMLDV